MSDKHWRKARHTKRTVWEYCETYNGSVNDEPREYVIGYIINKRNKRRCRDWLVYAYPYTLGGTYLGLLEDMQPTEAKQAAQLLIGAQK
jgi:hypothetical protein